MFTENNRIAILKLHKKGLKTRKLQNFLNSTELPFGKQ